MRLLQFDTQIDKAMAQRLKPFQRLARPLARAQVCGQHAHDGQSRGLPRGLGLGRAGANSGLSVSGRPTQGARKKNPRTESPRADRTFAG